MMNNRFERVQVGREADVPIEDLKNYGKNFYVNPLLNVYINYYKTTIIKICKEKAL